jgi:Uma2 family endonuclease
MTPDMKIVADTFGLFRFTVEQYHQMRDLGFFVRYGREELIEGYVVLPEEQTPQAATSRHVMARRLDVLVGDGWRVRQVAGLTLTDSELAADVCVARGPSRTYVARHPGPADVGLVVEAVDVCLHLAQTMKARIYARAGITEYWIVNLPDHQVEVYTQPSGPTATPSYGEVQVHPAGSSVPLVLDGVNLGAIAVDDVIF